MIYDVERFKDLCIKFDITPNQFFLLYLIYKRNWDTLREFTAKFKWDKEEVDILIKKGYIFSWRVALDEDRDIDYNTDIQINEEFETALWIDSDQAGQELFAAYPQFLSEKIHGRFIMAKSTGDRDKYLKLYAKNIANDIVLHRRVLASVEKARRLKQINVGIAKFIEDCLWEAYEALPEDDINDITAL